MNGYHFIEFKDEEIYMILPKYLRKKKSNRFFVADRRQINHPPIESISLEIYQDSEDTLPLRNTLAYAKEVNWGEARDELVQRGIADYVESGYEALWKLHNEGREILNKYDFVSFKNDSIFSLCAIGRGDIYEFYNICKKTIMSIRLNVN